ncbi:kinase A anchor protein [Xylariales sp. PMI_506]|nr:kinase A anchor protein [Xylariales sp. PMI_506]
MPPKPIPTHFLCIPLVTASSRPQLVSSLASFSADVTNSESFGVPAGAIRPVGTLHLTLGVMSFPKNEGVDRAVELLKALNPKQILSSAKPSQNLTREQPAESQDPLGPRQPLLSITLRGLHSMQSPSKASTLYSPPVDPDGTLQRFCEAIRSAFQEAGLMMDENRPLLLHATILNTIYVKGRRNAKNRGKITVDARAILDRYDDYLWMENVTIEKIAICRMGAKKLEDGEDEAYEVEADTDV